MTTQTDIQTFLAAANFAVAGASIDRQKYGNKVFRALVASGRKTAPINPKVAMVEDHKAYPSLQTIAPAPAALSIVTPPVVTRAIVVEAIAAGVQHVWMQPGAEDAEASEAARAAGLTVIDDGSCVLVELRR